MDEPVVKKGRRGLARKQTVLNQAQAEDSHSSIHNVNVYSSCVSSHGYRNIIGVGETETETSRVQEPSGSGDNITIANSIDKEEEHSQNDFQLENKEEDTDDMDEEDEEISIPPAQTVGPDQLRSPTPPPTADGARGVTKRRRMNKKLTSALRTLNMAKGNLEATPQTPFTKARRKRGKLIIHQTDMCSTSIFSMEDTSPLTKTEMLIKVRYLSNIHRLHLKLTDQFHNLLSHLSRETGQEERYLSLYLNDQVLPLSKTPKEVGLTVADIIECHCVKDVKRSDSQIESLSVLIQCSNSKRKTELNISMRESFQEVLKKYAEKMEIDASAHSFCFDGEDVDPNDTPLSLELEDGDILDLVPASTSGARSRSAWQNSVITIM